MALLAACAPTNTCSCGLLRGGRARAARIVPRRLLACRPAPMKRVELIAALRRLRMTAAEIAETLPAWRAHGVRDPEPDRAGTLSRSEPPGVARAAHALPAGTAPAS